MLAYQFGDGFSNIIIPTNAVMMGIIGIAGVPYGHLFRFCLPLLLKLMAAAALLLVLAVCYVMLLAVKKYLSTVQNL